MRILPRPSISRRLARRRPGRRRQPPRWSIAMCARPSRPKQEQRTKALALSDSSSMANIDQQAAYLKQRLDLTDFQDPTKLSKFLQRFAALYDIKNPEAATGSSTSSVTMLYGTSSGFSINADTLASI